MKETPLILASASPRRAELLRQLGLAYEVRAADVDETWLSGEKPEAHALRLAEAKAAKVASAAPPGRWVLAADTIVTLDGAVLGKPKDAEDAAAMLRRLSGREHRVVTAFCLRRAPEGPEALRAVETAVRVKRLGEQEIAAYVRTGEPMDKAGAYGAQGVGAFLVEGIEGSYSNVVGLPLAEVVEEMVRLGALTRYPP